MTPIAQLNKMLEIWDQSFEDKAGAEQQLTSFCFGNSVSETALLLWTAEKIGMTLPKNVLKNAIDQLVSHWNEPATGFFNQHEDVYTSNLALIYAALEQSKNNHDHPEIQQYLTAIRDYVFDHLLNAGKLISGVKTNSVSPDELLSVWPFELFSAEDLVLVQAADEIEQGYPTMKPQWQALYIHYLLSRSYFEQAEALYDGFPLDTLPSGLRALLVLRMDKHVSDTSKKETVHFLHSEKGNYNRYAPQETQRRPYYLVADEPVTLPVRVTSGRAVDQVTLIIEGPTGRQSKLMDVNKDLWTSTVALPIGNYSYWFSAKVSNNMYCSSQYKLSILMPVAVTSLQLVSASDQSLCLQMNGANMIACGTLMFTKVNGHLAVTLCPNQSIKVGSGIKNVSLISENSRVEFDSIAQTLRVWVKDKQVLNHSQQRSAIVMLIDNKHRIHRLSLAIQAHESEQFYGFGERYNALNQAGQLIDSYVYNQYRNQGIRTYMPMSLYLSSEHYALQVSSTVFTEFDLRQTVKGEPLWIHLDVQKGDEIILNLFAANSLKSLLPAVTAETGVPSMIPTWAMGLWMSSNNWDRQSVVSQQLKLANQYHIPATVFVLEQWSDEATYYMFNDSIYPEYTANRSINLSKIDFPKWGRWPDPAGMINEVHGAGMKLILWQIPVLKDYPKGRNRLLDQDKEYATTHHLVVENKDRSPYFIPEGWFTNALVWDPTNPVARDWWFSKRQYLLDLGVDGFKTDGGECIFGDHLRFADGREGRQMRNAYPNAYVDAYHRFISQNGGITFSRAGFTGAQTMPAHWAGDERSTFGAFKRSLKAGLNAGMSGLIFWGWDFSGFNGDIPSAELYLRATEMATFTPIMQYHAESKAQFNQDRTPWNIQERTGNKEVIPIFRRYANLRMNLLPYIFDQSTLAVRARLPLMRSLVLQYDDPRLANIFDEYLFGTDLLVAPVIEEGATQRDIYLPEGQWCDLWTESINNGGQWLRNVKTPLDRINVYQRGNSGILVNSHEGKLMTGMDNRLECYDQPLLRVFAISDFSQEIVDHLGKRIHIQVRFSQETQANVQITSDFVDLRVEVIGPKVVRIKLMNELE